MNILIDIGHPAHIHYYRNLSQELASRGNNILWTARNVKVIKELLALYEIDYLLLPGKPDKLLYKIIYQLVLTLKLLRICKKNKIDIAIGTSVSIVYVSVLSSTRSIVFDDDDDELQPLVTAFVNPFASYLLSPNCLRGKRKRKDTIYYPGYHELAYLHPNKFYPDKQVLNDLNLAEGQDYFILRFNAFQAHHDVGMKGLDLDQKKRLINELLPYGKVFITTERKIEPELRKYQLILDSSKIHSLMAFAKLFIGDSQTMSSEAAILGVPSLRCNSFAGTISYLEELEHQYGLTYAFKPDDFDQLLKKINELLTTLKLKEVWLRRKEKMLDDKIDVTDFWVWFIENHKDIKKDKLEEAKEFYNLYCERQ